MTLANFDLNADLGVIAWAYPLGTFTWGLSKLGGTDVLGDGEYQAFNINCEIVSIDIDTGSTIEDGIFTRPRSGVANVVLKTRDYDPFASGFLHVGTVIEIEQTVDEFDNKGILFSGVIDAADITYNSDGSTSFALTVTDELKKVFNATIPGTFNLATWTGHSAPFDTFEAIEAVITESGAGVSFFGDGVPAGLVPNITGADLDAGIVLNSLFDAELGFFYWDKSGFGLAGMARNFADNLTPVYTISNDHSTDPNHLCLAGINAGFSRDEIVNKVVATLESNDTIKATAVNQDMVDLCGEVTSQVTLNLYNSAALTNWVNDVTLRSNARMVKSVAGRAVDATNKMTALTNYNIGESIRVEFNRDSVSIEENYLVTGVSHQISVDGWVTELQLWKGN